MKNQLLDIAHDIRAQLFLNSQPSIFNLLQSCLNSFGFFFVTRFVQ